jgi:hypothetical protein
MTLKYEIESIEGLDEATTAMYKLDEASGKYRLDVDGVPDVTGLKTKVDELLNERKEDQRKARLAAEEAAKARGDVTALEASWSERHTAELGQKDSEIAKRDSMLANLTVGRTAMELASDLAVEGSAKALLPHIERRLRMEIQNGEPVVKILDAKGKLSAMTMEQLSEELKSDPALARIVSGSKASGGGADGGKESGGGATKALKDMNEAERVALARKDPDLFRKLQDEDRKAKR